MKRQDDEALKTSGESSEAKDSTMKKGKPHGKRRYSRKPGKPVDHNDPSWYNFNAELTKSAASLSFGEVTGTRLRNADAGNPLAHSLSGVYLPNIYAITLVHTYDTNKGSTPVIGTASTYGDELGAATVCARNIYSFVRHANSGHTNYEAPDLFMYLAAKAEAYSAFFYLVRMYGIMNTFDPRNRAYPKALLFQMGFNYDDLIQHIADIRYYILSTAKRLNALKTPKDFNFFNRAAFRYANLYKDCEDGKAATILTLPQFFLKWDPDTTSGSPTFGSRLTPVAMPAAGGALTWSAVTTLFNQIFNPLFGDEDIGIMSGDINKAYSSFHELPDIPENLQCYPIFDKNFLSALRNAKSASGYFPGPGVVADNFNLVQLSNGAIGQLKVIYSPTNANATTAASAYALHKQGELFNIDSETAEPVDILEWSAYSATTVIDSSNKVLIEHCATEIISKESLIGMVQLAPYGTYNPTSADNTREEIKSATLVTLATFSAAPTVSEVWQKIYDYTNLLQAITIDYLPLHVLLYVGGGFNSMALTNESAITYVGDINNYTLVTDIEQSKWHDCRWMSLFNIPAF